MNDVKTLSQIMAEPATTENQPEFFDDPAPVKKNRISIGGIIIRQAIVAGLIAGGFFLLKILCPEIFSEADGFIKRFIIPV